MDLQQIREQIKILKQEETKLLLKLRKEYNKEHDTYKIPDVEKKTWRKLEGQLHRTTLWRRAKKLKQNK